MLRFFVPACLVAGLAGCAAAPRPAVSAAPVSLPAARPDQGVIIAEHRVPSEDPQPIRQLLDRLGGAPAAGDVTEFIVRAADGATTSIVSPSQPGLQVGARVSILRGQPARLEAAEHVVAVR